MCNFKKESIILIENIWSAHGGNTRPSIHILCKQIYLTEIIELGNFSKTHV